MLHRPPRTTGPRVANRLKFDQENIATGRIVASYFETVDGEIGAIDDESSYSRYVLETEFPGMQGPITVKVFTGTALRSEPVRVVNAGRGKKNERVEYNKFTTLMLSLGQIESIESIDKKTDSDMDFFQKSVEKMVGDHVKARVEKNKRGFYAVLVDAIERVPAPIDD